MSASAGGAVRTDQQITCDTDVLRFEEQGKSGSRLAVFYLKNITRKTHAFKVKSSVRGRYMVRPPYGLLNSGQQVKVQVLLQGQVPSTPDTFVFESRALEADEVRQAEAQQPPEGVGTDKENPALLKLLKTGGVQRTVLQCTYKGGGDSSPASPAPPALDPGASKQELERDIKELRGAWSALDARNAPRYKRVSAGVSLPLFVALPLLLFAVVLGNLVQQEVHNLADAPVARSLARVLAYHVTGDVLLPD
eukprot:TRINITY_DN1028_c5_g1_i1.p1 TRINITY_DN1028_c5_g1~~TRINITY_DN1028_c5_g1_i1.p1  ORF type:complete len:250 (+),score=84.07 TRINITY_DN1028_c5_g1_i1:61-810(+)